jgi:hypothetical protein
LQDPVALARVDSTVNFDWSNTPPDPSTANREIFGALDRTAARDGHRYLYHHVCF